MRIQHEIGDYIEVEARAISEIDQEAFPDCNIVIWHGPQYFYCKALPRLFPGKYYATILDNQTLAIETYGTQSP